MLNFEPGLVFWTLVNFVLFLIVMLKVVVPALQKIVEERQTLVEKSLAEAAMARAEAERLREESKQNFQKNLKEADEYIRQLRAEQQKQQQKQQQEFLDNLDQLTDKHQQELNKMEDTLLQSIFGKASEYVIQACEKIIENDLPQELKEKVLANNLESLRSLKKL